MPPCRYSACLEGAFCIGSEQVFDRSEFTRQRAVAAMYAELEQACRDRLIVQEDVTVTKQRLSVGLRATFALCHMFEAG